MSKELRQLAAKIASDKDFESFSVSASDIARRLSEPSDVVTRVATRIISKKRKPVKKPARSAKPRPAPKAPPVPDDVTRPITEYSCQMEISVTADFEGSIDRTKLLRKLKQEMVASMEAGVKATARAFGLTPSSLQIRPLRLECVVSDEASVEDELDR